MRSNQRERKKLKMVALAVGLALLVGIGWVAVGSAYNNGVEAGKQTQKEAMEENLRNLGAAVQEKTEVLHWLAELNTEVPTTVATENIDTYIKKLEGGIDNVKNNAARAAIEKYLEAWKEFAETYSTKDNSAIAVKLDELRSAGSDAGRDVTEAYNQAITSAAERLPE